MVGVRRPERRDRTAGLRPRRRGSRVRVDDPADLRIRTIEREVGRRVGRWTQAIGDRLARVEIDRDEVLRPQIRIRHAARLDEHQAPVTVDAARVAERQGHQAGPHDGLVRGPDRLAQTPPICACLIAPSQTSGEVVVRLVPTDLVQECGQVDRLVDQQQLDAAPSRQSRSAARDRSALRHHRVVGSSGGQPCFDGDRAGRVAVARALARRGVAAAVQSVRRSRPRWPRSGSDRQGRPSPRPPARARAPREDEPDGIRPSTDGERMDLARRPVTGDGRTDLQHVRAEDLRPRRIEMVRVVLHERRSTRQAGSPSSSPGAP